MSAFEWLKRWLSVLLIGLTPGLSQAGDLKPFQIKAVMHQAEHWLQSSGINVQGYAGTAPPLVEFVARDHVYLQGNDGAFIAGRIFVRDDAPEDCKELILLHEIVHDATAKFRLFRSVPNSELRTVIEALADRVTEAAAANPYRPRCLTHREFEISGADLAQLAMR